MTQYESQLQDLFESYRQSLRQRELPQAVEIAVQMDEQIESIDVLIADFKTAVRNGDKELAGVLLRDISSRIDQISKVNKQRSNKALAATESGNPSQNEREELLEYTRTIASAKLEQSIFITTALNFLENAEDEDPTLVVETASTVEERETELESRHSDLAETVANSSIGPVPSIVQEEPVEEVVKNTTVDTEITISNVGDEKIVDAQINESSDDGMAVTIPDTSLTIPPEEEEVVTVQLQPTSAGEYSVSIELITSNSETPDDSLNMSLSVRETELDIREAIIGEENNTASSADILSAISMWAADERVSQTGGKTVDTDVLQDLITDWLESQEGGES